MILLLLESILIWWKNEGATLSKASVSFILSSYNFIIMLVDSRQNQYSDEEGSQGDIENDGNDIQLL